jgi:hypothetical protein
MSTCNNIVQNLDTTTNISFTEVCACNESSFFILEHISCFNCCSLLDVSNNISIKGDVLCSSTNAYTYWSKEEDVVVSKMKVCGSFNINTPSISMMEGTVSN